MSCGLFGHVTRCMEAGGPGTSQPAPFVSGCWERTCDVHLTVSCPPHTHAARTEEPGLLTAPLTANDHDRRLYREDDGDP